MARHRAQHTCTDPGCDTLIPAGDGPHCPDHRPPDPRPSAHRRGYDTAHRNQRATWAPRVATGTVPCWRCGHLIKPDEPWDLGHDDHDRTITRGPEHRRCNRSAAGRSAHRGWGGNADR